MRYLLVLAFLIVGFGVHAQQPHRSWDGKYYYDGDFMSGWVAMNVNGKVDTIKGYVKQYIPYDDQKSCKSVLFKKLLKSGKEKYDADQLLAYFRYDELFVSITLPNKKKAFAKQLVGGRISLFSYYGSKMDADLAKNLSFSTEKELVRYDYIRKDGKLHRIDWDDPYVFETLKVWFADCLDFDNSELKQGITIDELVKVVETYNSKCEL